jgi:hypothetical protein
MARAELTAEQKREYRRRWMAKPRACQCDQPGVHPLCGGQEWVCERCHAIELRNQAARLKYAARGPVERTVVEPYRVHCEV